MATAAKAAVGGAIQIAPTTATLPTTADGALTGFTSLGYISDAGLTRSFGLESEMIKSWGGAIVGTLNTGKTETFKFALLDATEAAVLKLVYGDSNVTTASGVITANSTTDQLEAHAFVIDMILADSKIQRIVIPNGVVTEIGDVTYVDNAAVQFEVTITAVATAGSNTTAIDYIK